MRSRKQLLFFIPVISALLFSCSSDDDVVKNDSTVVTYDSGEYQKAMTKIPDDISKLFSAKGNLESDTVFIFEQGGPEFELYDTFFEVEDDFEVEFKKFFKSFYRVYVHQALTLNGDILCPMDKPTKAFSRLENQVTIEILDRVIKHFKSKGKTVYVAGHSYGGFIVTKYIADRGNATADKFLIMASRLNMQTIVTDGFSKCEAYYFKNGTQPTVDDREDRKDFIEKYLDICPTTLAFAGAIASERFTETITQDDLSNVIFVYANDDEQTGDLLPMEEDFLSKKRVKTIEIPAGQEGHGAMFYPPYTEQIHQLLIK